MKLNDIISSDKKMATISDLRNFVPGTKVDIFNRNNKTFFTGTVISVPKNFSYISHMTDDDFFEVDSEFGILKVKKHIWNNNIASLTAMIDGVRSSINFVIKCDIPKINKKTYPRNTGTSDSVAIEKIVPDKVDMIRPPVKEIQPRKAVMMYRNVVLDMAGNFYEQWLVTDEVPMEELTKKIVACHQMSGSLEWLKEHIRQVESGMTQPVNEFHKNRM